MKNIYLALAIAITFFASSNLELLSQERENTDLFFTAGLFASGNLFSSSFSQLPGISNNYPLYESAFSVMPGVNLGIEKKLASRLFNCDLRYSANIRFSLMSGKYDEQEFLGYDIEANDYSKLYSNYELAASLPTVLLENSLVFYPSEKMPLSFKVGANIGAVFGQSMEQGETLSKEDRFYENGYNSQNEFSGDIPDANPLYLGLTAGVRYEGFDLGSFKLMPEIAFNYALMDVASDVDWKVHNITAGVSIVYNKPVALPPIEEPKEPVTPKLHLPENPPAEKQIALAIDAYANNLKLANGTDVIMDLDNIYTYDEYTLPTILYYENNQISSYVFAADSIIKLVIMKMNDNPKLKLQIKASSPKSDAEMLNQTRADIIKNTATTCGISEKRISITTKVIDEEYKYPELANEDRRVELLLSDNTKLLTCKMVKDKHIKAKQQSLKINPIITADAGVKSFTGTVISDMKSGVFADFGTEGVELFLDKSFIKLHADAGSPYTNIKLMATLVDNDDKKAEAELQFSLIPDYSHRYEKIEHGGAETYVIGFSHFDYSAFYSTNKVAIQKAKDAIKNGKKIRLIAMTDSFGEDEYNDDLSKKRMRNAMKLIGIKAEQAELIYRKGKNHRTAFERSLSRAVYLEIIE